MQINLGFWTFLQVLLQFLVALRLTIVAYNAEVSHRLRFCTIVILWAVWISFTVTSIYKNLNSIEEKDFTIGVLISQGITATLNYSATLFVVYHLYLINDETIQLAI